MDLDLPVAIIANDLLGADGAALYISGEGAEACGKWAEALKDERGGSGNWKVEG